MNVVHDRCYKNRALCGVILMPYAFISKNIDKLTCPICKKIALAIEDQRFVIRKLRRCKDTSLKN